VRTGFAARCCRIFVIWTKQRGLCKNVVPPVRICQMEENPGKKQLLLVVLSIASLVFGTKAIAPALADIAKAFPDSSPQTIQMILVVPSLLIMVSTLICGHLSRHLGKKTLVVIGMLLFGIGGISPAFFGNLGFLLVMMGVFGAGSGFLVPLSQSLVADYFEGREREEFMGYRSSNAAVFGMLFALLGGSLCAIHWRLTFLSFLIVVPMLAFVLWKMPQPVTRSTGAKNTLAASLTGKMWFYIAGYFLYNVIGISVATNAAFVMSGCGIGTRTIGIIMTISSGRIAARPRHKITRVSNACVCDGFSCHRLCLSEFCRDTRHVYFGLGALRFWVRDLYSDHGVEHNRQRPQACDNTCSVDRFLRDGGGAIRLARDIFFRQRVVWITGPEGFLGGGCLLLHGSIPDHLCGNGLLAAKGR
jgi:MFS family permease